MIAMAALAWPTGLQAEALTPEQAHADALSGTSPKVGKPGRVNLLVHIEPGAERGPLFAFTRSRAGHVRYEYRTVLPNVIALRDIPPSAVAALSAVPGVAKVEGDVYQPDLVKLHDSIPLVRGLASQLAAAGLSAADGFGVRVCVVDTGIDSNHLMYASRIDTAAGKDFANNDDNPEDDHGHGAHVSGIVLGRTGLTVSLNSCDGSEPFQGVAPEATLIGVKVLNQFGGGFSSDIIAGIDHCADPNLPNGPADVINLSIGTGQFTGSCTHSWALAANNAVDAGVTVVAAAGNEAFSNALASPACGSKVIAVGATYDANFPNCQDPTTTEFAWCADSACTSILCTDTAPSVDDLICFSNQSDDLDVSAPGCDTWSAAIGGGGNSITAKCGTSMAAPHVAGLAALILSLDPSVTPAQVRQIIRDGAIDLGPGGFDRGYGHGRIDVISALHLVQPEVCGNGTCRANEDQCNCAQDCGTPPVVETSCSDGVDEDCDTFTDCDDTDCSGDPACICDDDGTCELGEDCNNCPNDCPSASGASCGNGVCEAGDGEDCVSCPSDCNGKQNGRPSGRFCCGDGDGGNPIPCNDERCAGGGVSCTDTQATGTCCGDGTCEGSEDTSSCGVDCAACTVDGDCSDGDSCTIDSCSEGFCSNDPMDCDDSDACTNDTCSGGSCSYTPVDCDDGDACTFDSCDSVTGCANDFPACSSVSDGCCGPGCDSGNDVDCPSAVCGNGVCEGSGEDCFSCSADCRCAGPACDACCGDGVCGGRGEKAKNCPVDCP
jgi:subtilisin family serine protease